MNIYMYIFQNRYITYILNMPLRPKTEMHIKSDESHEKSRVLCANTVVGSQGDAHIESLPADPQRGSKNSANQFTHQRLDL